MISSATHPVEADLSLSVAGGEVGLGLRRGALGAVALTHAMVSALRLLSALVTASLVNAFACTTRTLAGTFWGREKRRVKTQNMRTPSLRDIKITEK